jgi:uncharacterized protein (DUF2164 family)
MNKSVKFNLLKKRYKSLLDRLREERSRETDIGIYLIDVEIINEEIIPEIGQRAYEQYGDFGYAAFCDARSAFVEEQSKNCILF